MRRTEWLQETRKMRFEQAFGDWTEGRLSQDEAAQLLGVCARSFRRYVQRYEASGLEGLLDLRLGQVLHRRAPVDEVMALTERYRRRHSGWNVKHFYPGIAPMAGRAATAGSRTSCTAPGWSSAPLAAAPIAGGASALPLIGMLLHQDGSTHKWTAGAHWDLIVTMDDATSEHYLMFFVEQKAPLRACAGCMKWRPSTACLQRCTPIGAATTGPHQRPARWTKPTSLSSAAR